MGQLNVIGFNKAVLPVGQDRERTGCVRALDNRIRIRQVDCALLADDLTLDVVTVSVRNLNLYVNTRTGLGFQQHDLRVVVTLGRARGLAHLEHLTALILIAEQPAAYVQLVDCNVGNAHLGLEAVRLRHVTVARVNHQRRTQLTGVDDALHLGVAAVIVAHKADLYQTLAVCGLGRDDFLAVGGTLCQRLLAEHLLARFESLEHIACVARVGRGDNDRLHLRCCNQLLAGLVCLHAFVLRRNLNRSFFKIVCTGNNLTARNNVRQASNVIAANCAAANNTNIQHADPLLLTARIIA